MKIITFTNDKGGNGKTTCAVNLAYIFSKKGYKVLLIDTDAQCNASDRLKVWRNKYSDRTIFQYFFNNKSNKSVSEYIIKTMYPNLDALICDTNFNNLQAEVEICINGPANNRHYYRKMAEELERDCDYDYVIIDTHPGSTDRTKPIFEIAHYILIPTDLDGQSDVGGMRLVNYVNTMRNRGATITEFIGFVLYRVSERTSIVKTVVPELKKKHSVFETIVPASEIVKQSIRLRLPTPLYSPSSKVSLAFNSLAEEVLNTIGKEK